MDELQTLLQSIEKQFGFPMEFAANEAAEAKSLSLECLAESRKQLQEKIGMVLCPAFAVLKRQFAVAQPLLQAREELDRQIITLKAILDSIPLADEQHEKM